MNQVRDKNIILIFRHSLWKKIYSLILFFAIAVAIISGCASENVLWIGVLVTIGIYLIFDNYNKKLFSKILLQQNALIYQPGGIFWKWLNKEEQFSWNIFDFTVDYYNYKDKIYYSSLHIADKKGKICLVLNRNIANFDQLIEELKKCNPDVKLISIEENIKRRFST
jgi:hypothetical protein